MGIVSRRTETIEQTVERLFKENRAGEVENELRKFSTAALQGKEKEAWHLYWGLAAFKRGDRQEAFRRFENGHAECPESHPIAFALGQEYEARADPERMLALFNACSFPQISAQHLLTASRYCYLWDLTDHGMRLLDPIRAAYFQLGIADDHFVYVRGLPFFSQTWSYILCFCVLTDDFTVIDEFTTKATRRLSGYDFGQLVTTLQWYKTRSCQEKIEELDRYLRNADPRFPQGYPKTQLACLRAVSIDDVAKATECLDSVALTDRDFKWLADVILVHRARLAGKAGDNEREATLAGEFLSRRPLLFEPDHAVNFAFLDYQEKLKAKYRELRKAQPPLTP